MTRARTLADIGDLNIDSNTLVIDTSNNRVGIGTASPDRSLHIAGSEPSVVFENTGQGTDLKTWRIYSNSSSLQVGTVDDAFSAGQNALEITRDNTDNITGIQFKTGASSERMRIDANNCVGINITPSSWSGHNGVLQVGNSSLANFSQGAYLNANSYYDGSNNRYIASDEASRYYQSSGQHVWQSAASGTAGNAISFSTKMMINASGNVGIATASPANILHIKGSASGEEIFNIDNSAGSGVHGDTNNNIRVTSNNNSHWANLVVGAHMLNVLPQGGASMLAVTTTGVGIGITAPDTNLHVQTSSGNPQMRVESTGADYVTYSLKNSSRRYSTQIRTDQNNAYVIRDETGGANRFFISTGGQVCIGDNNGSSYTTGGLYVRHTGGSSNSSLAVVNGTTSGNRRMIDFFGGTSTSRLGSIQIESGAIAFNTSSDYRLKENLNYTWDATARLKQLKPVQFNWISDDTNTVMDGFLAHEVSGVVPFAISGEKDEVWTDGSPMYQQIDQSKLVPLLVKTIQELEARIATLEAGK